MNQLNTEQREAVLHVDGPLLILAGAGSGKTRVIAYRMAYLIGAGFAEPHEVLAVTFTNKAADEMRQRVASLIGVDGNGLWISTFHSLCARLLRREAPAIGLTRDFVIYDSADQMAVVKQALKELGIDDKLIPPRLALSRISQAKNRMEGSGSLRGGWNFRDEQIARVFDRYIEALAESNALDFDDLLLKTVELFERSDAVRAKYQRQFRYLMVDEYQDTNRPQYLMVRRLAELSRNLAVVGDPDQSIYKWRGADLRNIIDFEHDFPEVKTVRLERNYRSTQVILDTASALIRQNRDRKDKRLWTDRQGGARVVYYRGSDELDEAAFICRLTREATMEGAESRAAVLYRINAQSRAIEDALIREGVAYRIVGSVRFYERKEIKDTLAYLKLLLNPHDDVSFRRVVNTPARGIGKSVFEALEAAGSEGETEPPPLVAAGLQQVASARSLWARASWLLAERRLPPRSSSSLRAFVELIAKLSDLARQEPVSTLVERALDLSGYLTDLRDERSEEAEGRIENLQELVSAAREYETRESDASLAGFVDRLSLLSDVDEEEGSSDARLWLMTMHAAKGLEFPVVVIAGLEEGLCPHSRASEDEADIEEERRLCYVGMTRAQQQLVLTGAARRRIFGEYQPSEPSRFLDELPRDLVDERESAFVSPWQSRLPQQRGWRPESSRGPSRAAGPRLVREAAPAYRYEDEDQSAHGVGLKLGARVRHPLFGVGTVLSVEPEGDDIKLTVSFASVGRKKLRAKFARLEPA